MGTSFCAALMCVASTSGTLSRSCSLLQSLALNAASGRARLVRSHVSQTGVLRGNGIAVQKPFYIRLYLAAK
eukprot:6198615-Pleurochrysis_carterae.AAC.2